jgi:hypothetical protein
MRHYATRAREPRLKAGPRLGNAPRNAEKTFGEFPEIEQVLADVKAALGQ